MKRLLQQMLLKKEITKAPLISMRGRSEDLFYTFSLESSAEAKEALNKMRAINHEVDLRPICLGGIDDYNFLVHHLENHSLGNVNTILQKANTLDFEKWKCERALAVLEDVFSPKQYPDKMLSGFDYPSLIPSDGPIFIGLFPTTHSWEALAVLNFGDGKWSDCPQTHVHVALLRKLERLLNADIYAIRKNGSPPKSVGSKHKYLSWRTSSRSCLLDLQSEIV